MKIYLDSPASPYKGERIEVRGFNMLPGQINPHPALSLVKGEAKR
jgi:hypothetical protein